MGSEDTTERNPRAPDAHQDLPRQDAQGRYQITPRDLPLHCPLPSMSLWNAHPRVFLPIEETGEEACPYCGTKYVLKDAAP